MTANKKNKANTGNKPLKQPALTTGTNQRKAWLIAAAIVILTCIIYAPSLKNDFVNWDDQEYVTENPLVTDSHVPLKEFFTTPVSNHYHPLTMLSLAWNNHNGKLDPEVYHETNLVLHLLNTLLVFFFIFLLTRRNLLMASIVALFFGIHPMHVESVAWISERKDVLYSFFFLAGLITYIYYKRSKKTTWYIITFILFILSCLSKVMAIVFPLVLILIDYYNGELNGIVESTGNKFLPLFKKIFSLEKIPFFILSIVFAVVGYLTQIVEYQADFVTYPLFDRILFACYGAVMYIVKFIVPSSLSCFYPYPSMKQAVSAMIYFPFILLSFVAIVYFFFRKEKPLVFGLLFYFFSVVLILQLVTVGAEIIADRYSYVSYIGLLFPVAYYVNKSWKEKNNFPASMKYPLTAILIIAAISFCYETSARIQVWKNGETLWTDAINKHPNVFIAYSNRGEYYQSLNEDDKAMADFNIALRLNPAYSEAYNNRGLIYYKNAKYDLALSDYGNAIKYNGDRTQSSSYYVNHGLANMRLKNNVEAEKDMQKAFTFDSLSLRPNSARLLVNRGFYYDQTNQYEKAIADYSRYLQLKPDDDVLYNARGLCYVKLNKINDAWSDFSKAAELKPNVPNYWLNRSASENTLGRRADAKADAQKAMDLGMQVDPNYMKDLETK